MLAEKRYTLLPGCKSSMMEDYTVLQQFGNKHAMTAELSFKQKQTIKEH
jgi:hypothetical protein